MHGGMNPYHGSPAAARHYVEADRGRADDYYLAEGTGIAERYVASPGGGVHRLEPLTGHGYEAWVAGVDPDTGVAKGRLRNDDQAVRFVEVIVNGPKSWSLAAELHPDISRAYDAAQDRAAAQIIGWLAQHATTRVGPRGAQLQVPVAEIEAVTVRHHTSRAGDPHRHLHLQINARVFAEGQWRGLHTVGVRDCLDAIQRHRARRRHVRSGVPGTRSPRAASPSIRSRARSPSWPRSWVRSAPGRRRSDAISPATKRTGGPRTRDASRIRGCAECGMRGPGPTPDRTRSCRVTGPN